MMESARQELQGRREYMSNDEIKRVEGVDQMPWNSCSFVDHLWFHLIYLFPNKYSSLGWQDRLRVQSHQSHHRMGPR